MLMTGNDVIEETLRLLLSSQREEMNKLQGGVSAGATSLAFKYSLGGIRSGSLIDIDLETYRVWSVVDSSNTAVVEPAMTGTVTSSHADGSYVYVNPKMSRASIFKAMNDELLALSGVTNGLFAMKFLEFNFTGAVSDYDLGVPNIIDIYETHMSVPGPTHDWVELNWCKWKPNSDPTDFPSGNVLHVTGGIPGRAIRVLYKAPFTKLTAPTDDIATVAGMPEEMQDILALGVLLRLGPVREIKRSFTETQGDTRRSEEVPGGIVFNSFNAVRQLCQDRIMTEAARLAQKYPMRHK